MASGNNQYSALLCLPVIFPTDAGMDAETFPRYRYVELLLLIRKELIMIVYYVDGVCGSFKTTNALEYAVKAATKLGEPILFAQPTHKLITESINRIKDISSKLTVKRFDSATCPGSVFSNLNEFMSQWDTDNDGGCIVFITHKCLWEMPYFPRKQKWNLIVDEIPDIDFEYHLNLPDTHEFAISNYLSASECGINSMMKLETHPAAIDRIQHWAKNPGNDDIIKVVQPLFRELVGQHSNTFITRASWNRLGCEGHGQINVHGWRGPGICDGWKSVRIMGAFFKDSLLHMIWSNMGVEFYEDQQISVAAQRHSEELGERVSIHYFRERSWSKKVRDKIAKDDDAFAYCKPLIRDIFTDDEFLYSANNDIDDGVVNKDFTRAIRIPPVCHGLNEYRHIVNIAFLSALNNTPGHYAYMDAVLGISGDLLRQARSHQVAYQSIMRTALRDAGSTAEVKVLVPDIALANWLVDVFPGASLYAHDIGGEFKEVLGNATKARGRPRKAAVLTPTERSARSYLKARDLIQTKNTIYKAFFVRDEVELSHELSVKSHVIERTTHANWDDIKYQLRQCLDQVHVKKPDNTLVSGALYDANKSKDAFKGIDNITLINGVWLDFDWGVLTPQDFSVMFRDAKWFLYNTHGNGEEGLIKYRVVFPTTTPITPDMYHMIWDAMAARIKEFGYYVGSKRAYENAKQTGKVMPPPSGLDISKRTANSFFYIPCRAGLGKKYTFWLENWGDGVPLLDPDLWITYAPLEPQEYEIKPAYENPKDARLQRVIARLQQPANDPGDATALQAQRQETRERKIQEAIMEWRSTPEHTGNAAFYRLACRLHGLGMSDGEIRATLEREVVYANNVGERRSQIPSIMKSLRRMPARMAA